MENHILKYIKIYFNAINKYMIDDVTKIILVYTLEINENQTYYDLNMINRNTMVYQIDRINNTYLSNDKSYIEYELEYLPIRFKAIYNSENDIFIINNNHIIFDNLNYIYQFKPKQNIVHSNNHYYVNMFLYKDEKSENYIFDYKSLYDDCVIITGNEPSELIHKREYIVEIRLKNLYLTNFAINGDIFWKNIKNTIHHIQKNVSFENSEITESFFTFSYCIFETK